MPKFVLLAIVTLLLCGCASQWVKNRATAEDFSSANAACTDISENKYPVKNKVAQRTNYVKTAERCKKGEDCGGKKYQTTERPETQSYVMDVNSDSRYDEFYRCMTGKGWQQEMRWL
ncbi:hypothetical protein [Biostraticola tofi]|uniref:Lipoprotein n=1 Tax=Biostraticola tofi TaxID=466109 RepID=A0A4R3YW23_9GAMM|nr:hypothetical protein [Biostraticola tofi]TCV96702.1 hypothetical protein EDC52_104142 [Biostraticola tofi]